MSGCAQASANSDKSGEHGDFELYGRAIPADEPDYRQRYAEALVAVTGMRPPGPFHLFRVDITSAAFV